MSQDGGRTGDVPPPLGPSGGDPPVYESGGNNDGTHPGHLQFTGPIIFQVRTVDGQIVDIVSTIYEGQVKLLVDAAGNKYKPSSHGLTVALHEAA